MLHIQPINITDAKHFITAHHRHHCAPVGAKFAIAVADADQVVGVAMVGRPVARALDDGWTAEVIRVATTGVPNACSMLYGACWRAAKGMGYRKLITYTLAEEGGSSLRAAGWKVVNQRAGGGSWSTPSRLRIDKHPLQTKLRWEAC